MRSNFLKKYIRFETLCIELFSNDTKNVIFIFFLIRYTNLYVNLKELEVILNIKIILFLKQLISEIELY